MWKQVEVFAAGKLVSSGSSNYHFKSYMKTLLHNCKDEGEKKKMCTEMFYEDKSPFHDYTHQLNLNEGAYERQLSCGPNHTFEMEGFLGKVFLMLINTSLMVLILT